MVINPSSFFQLLSSIFYLGLAIGFVLVARLGNRSVNQNKTNWFLNSQKKKEKTGSYSQLSLLGRVRRGRWVRSPPGLAYLALVGLVPLPALLDVSFRRRHAINLKKKSRERLLYRLLSVGVQDMPVYVEGHLYALVTHQVLHHLHVHACPYKVRSEAVPEPVRVGLA